MKSKKLTLKQAEKAFIQLGWLILECKLRYYHPSGYEHIKVINDHDYDELEKKYIKLAKVLKKEPVSTNMVGFDFDRPSCRLVASQKAEGKLPMLQKYLKTYMKNKKAR